MKQFLSKFPFHALFFSVYPILYLYMVNRVFIVPESVLRSLLVSAVSAIFFIVAFYLILKNWAKAGMLCSIVLFLFYTFGHVYNLMQNFKFDLSTTMLGWIWLLVFLVSSFFILRSKPNTNLTFFLNIISFGLLLMPIWTIGFYKLTSSTLSLNREREKLAVIRGQREVEKNKTLTSQPPPDIYYILVDGYERADFLQSNYSYDNSEFLTALEQRDFFVALESRSNYMNTTYSMNTSLNMEYFHRFPPNLIKDARYNLQTNHVTDFLRDFGYRIIVFDSGTGDSNNQHADEFLSPCESTKRPYGSINAFELLLMRTTMLIMVISNDLDNQEPGSQQTILYESVNRELDLRRERIQYTFDHLADYATDDSPQFIFAHIYSPHIPFLYEQNGSPLSYDKNVTIYWYETSTEQYVSLYAYQIEFLNENLITVIDQILQNSSVPPIIILQSDHGDDHYLDWKNPDTLGVNIRSAILYSVYYPDQDYSDFYPTITPVNTFRLLFNKWFNTTYPLLPDQVYFHEHPLKTPPNQVPEFMDACQIFQICLPDYSQ